MVNAITSMFESSLDELSFKLTAGDHDASALAVAGFAADEGLSTLFAWNIDVVIDPDTTPTLDDTIARDAEFQILRNDEVLRTVRGIIGQVTPKGASGNQRLVTLSLVPKLAELQYVENTRIFQDLTVAEIVAELLKPHNIEPDWRILGRPMPRVYRVQKNETDYTFFRRILADEGIHFHFAHTKDKTKVAFVNDAKGYEPIDGEAILPYRDIGGAVTLDHVGHADQRRRLRPGSTAMRDYDFETPGEDLKAREEVKGPHNDEHAPRREVYIYPGEYREQDLGTSLAKRRLEEARSDALTFSAKSSCVHMEVARTFTLEHHPEDSFNRELIVTRTTLSGRRAGILADTGQGAGPGFSVTFSAVPSETPLRPTRTPRPATHPESARVVGPTSGSPFIDKYGRVKVQFHWDRQGKNDEHSSCWLRVMTPAAGANRGIWFPPRVDDEVIVMHTDGDIDQPFVAGALYNGVEKQPYALPGESSKSTIKGLSIPGGKGFNELTFEDKAGKEEIFLHAQKDRRTAVLHNHNETVGANQSSTVGANQSITVGANRTVTVGANETISVGAVRSETVKKTEDVTVHKGRVHNVLEGDDVLNLPQGHRTVNVNNGNLTHNVRYVDKTEADFVHEHGRIEVAAIGDTKVYLEQKGATYTMQEQTVVVDCPSGTVSLKDDKITLNAVAEIVLQCGKASMSLKSDGTIELTAATKIVTSVASSSVTLDPRKSAVAGPSVEVNAVGQAKIQGAIVKIN